MWVHKHPVDMASAHLCITVVLVCHVYLAHLAVNPHTVHYYNRKQQQVCQYSQAMPALFAVAT